MNNAAATPRHLTAAAGVDAQQLTLLPDESVTARFRLSRETRERGLRHVAEIRRMLAEHAAERPVTAIAESRPRVGRRDQAA